MHRGYFRLWRALFDKPIWKGSSSAQKNILIVMLSLASHKFNEWDWNNRRFTIQAGEFVTSLKSLAQLAGVSIRNVRTAIDRFENLEFLTNQSTNRGRLIKIINWGTYQQGDYKADKPNDKPLTSPRQAPDKLLTTINNDKNVKNDKNVIKEKDIYCRVVQYLNQKTGKKFSDKSKTTRSFIKARINDGFNEQEFYVVIDNKCSKWLSDPKMMEFLRPQTLFGTKFESYLQDTPHPLQGIVSSKTMRNIENLKRLERRSKDEK